MAFTRSFEGYRPPKRFNAIACDRVDIEESAERDAGFNIIETVPLVPVDPDPANPATRNVTTDEAVLDHGWYRLVWRTPADASFIGDPTFFAAPNIPFPLNRPSPADIYPRSELLRQRFPDVGDEGLALLVADADVWVEQTVGRIPLETAVPEGLERIALQAVTMKAEEFATRRARRYRSGAALRGDIKSFTAGSYSETRQDPGFTWAKYLLSADPDLQEALWLLLTEERQEEIRSLATGKPVPASEAVSFDWDRSRRVKPPGPY